jgi:hypothetical protein
VRGDNPNQSGERLALTSLFHAAGGENWIRLQGSKWNSDLWICYWDGVECSGDPGNLHVTSLSLVANGLKGTIPPELKQLVHLQVLDLSDNKLEGPIPEELASLTHLETLRLKQNMLTGDIPEGFSRLLKLEIFDVSRNLVSGALPRIGQAVFGCGLTCLCDEICSPRMTPDSLFNPRAVACQPCPARVVI